MRRLAHRLRRPSRWPEETHMLIGGAVTIALIFGAVFVFAKIGNPPQATSVTVSSGGHK
jgi:hypothetical protein